MIQKTLKKSVAVTLFTGILLGTGYSAIEPSYLRAQTASDTVQVTLNVTAGIAITSPVDITMSPNISSAQDTSIGGVVWNVKSSDADGYTLAVKASTDPAMQSGANVFDDYTEATPGTPDAWSVTGAAEFGYSAFGDDVNSSTWGTDSSCGSGGTIPSNLKYAGFSTTDKVIATGSTVTPIAGVDTSVCFAAEQEGVYAAGGTYTAQITATATVQ